MLRAYETKFPTAEELRAALKSGAPVFVGFRGLTGSVELQGGPSEARWSVRAEVEGGRVLLAHAGGSRKEA